MQILANEAFSFDDVLLVPQKSEIWSRTTGCDTTTTLGTLKLPIPIIAANMDTITGHDMILSMNSYGGGAVLHRNMPAMEALHIANEIPYNANLMVAVGIWSNDATRIKGLLDLAKRRPITFCIDVAHGHSMAMEQTIKKIRDSGFEGDIIAGNVVTRQAVRDLEIWGATIAKVGIGPGSACTTRTKTGCGFPQLAAVAQCADVSIPVIADGGIRSPGDAAKCLAVGAAAVMVGGVLAGSDRTIGWDPRKAYSQFRGMASRDAKEVLNQKVVNMEGISKAVPTLPAGSTKMIVQYFQEGIKSAMSYVGARNLNEFREKAVFVRATSNITNENSPHDASVGDQLYGEPNVSLR